MQDSPITHESFVLYRALFGSYLTTHFITLFPYGAELFSNVGVIKTTSLLPAYNKLPISLLYYDSPLMVNIFIGSLILCSMALTIGYKTRLVSSWLFYGWISLFNRNIFISNPSLSYIGWILLSFICVPTKAENWQFPKVLYYGLWAITGISYTASGLHKLQCPSWIDGTALNHVLIGLLSRKNFIVDFLLQNQFYLKIMTWITLFAEISFLFLGVFKKTRMFYWFLLFGLHIGILLTVNFSDLTLGMIVSHLYLFDQRWLNKMTIEHISKKKQKIVNMIKDSSQSLKNPKIDLAWFVNSSVASISIIMIGVYLHEYDDVLSRLTNLTLSSLWGFTYIIIVLGFFMTLERAFPAVELNEVRGWWKWVLCINIFQLFAVILASFTWEKWLQKTSYFTSTTGFHMRDHVSPFVGGLIAYVINQWIFYWWHYFRHQIYILWILFHQFHHSPSRIETITSFYKHPFEIIVDSQIMAILLYSILGLTHESSIWLSIFSAIGEYLYHMNIKTPKFVGYFFQRPESHRLHHQKDKRIQCPNYSDLPLWDMLNDTFENPEVMEDPCGFTNERQRLDMIFFKDVIKNKKYKNVIPSIINYILVIWGLMSSSAFIVHSNMAQKTSVFVSSPLPLVFTSFNGIETFSSEYWIIATFENGTIYNIKITHEMYSKMEGAYNRKNVYGAIFAFGSLLEDKNMIALRQEVLNYAICDPALVIKEFGIHEKIKHMNIYMTSRFDKLFKMDITCLI